MIAVIGSTGKVGTELITLLIQQQQPVRALAHSDESVTYLNEQGVEVVQGSYTDDNDLNQLLADVDKLFLLTPSSPQQSQIESHIIDMAKRNGVEHIVYLSVLDADADITAMRLHYETEQHLKAMGIGYTILRPNNFMQNFHTDDLPTILHQDGIFNPAGNQPISFVDARDVAAVACEALIHADHIGKMYEITGKEALTYEEAAERIAAKLNKTVNYVYVPPQPFRDNLVQVGVPAFYADILAEMYDYWNKHGAGRISNDVETVLRREPYSLDDYLDAYRDQFALSSIE